MASAGSCKLVASNHSYGHSSSSHTEKIEVIAISKLHTSSMSI